MIIVPIWFTNIFKMQNDLPSTRTLDLASILEVGSSKNQPSGDKNTDYHSQRSILTIAFQFPYEAHLEDTVSFMARQYVRSIVASVQRVSMAITGGRSGHNIEQKLLPAAPEAVILARWLCNSYKYVNVYMYSDCTELNGYYC